MSNKDTVDARVIDGLGDKRYRVELESGETKIAYLAGRMVKHRISVHIGDIVEVVLDPYGGTATNRIVRRK